MSKSCIIFGSSRNDGNTQKMVDVIQELTGAKVYNLNDYKISYYSYKHDNNDDFIPLFKQIVEYDHIIFATPVYWYTMSAVMKTFFDRISEPLRTNEHLTDALKGKSMLLFNMSSSSEIYPFFHHAFEQSANFLNMVYKGHVHCWLENKSLPDSVLGNIKLLLKDSNITK